MTEPETTEKKKLTRTEQHVEMARTLALCGDAVRAAAEAVERCANSMREREKPDKMVFEVNQ